MMDNKLDSYNELVTITLSRGQWLAVYMAMLSCPHDTLMNDTGRVKESKIVFGMTRDIIGTNAGVLDFIELKDDE